MRRNKKLVAYFSATGVTAEVAALIAKFTDSDLFEIKPLVPYTNEDLNWMDKKSRSSVEMQDRSFRPQIASEVKYMNDYNTIYLGFPIWWYTAPTIINTFLEQYDFSDKKIILFATSGSSDLGMTKDFLKESVSETTELVEGGVLNNASPKSVAEWIVGL